MANPLFMAAPVCLIENTHSGELLINPEALRILSQINEPVVVITIVGMYRTGKSYLMNKLAGRKNGFSLGATVQAHTKGIWMWCVPHPHKQNHTLILLDTEGLGDVEKGDQKNDCWIFALAVLLSSTFVYNSMGTIDHYALEKLHYVSELTDLIKVKATKSLEEEDKEEEEDIEYVRFFPNFVWVVRDFTLELIIEDQPVTEDEYLEYALKLKKGNNKQAMMYNLPRLCIRNFFPSRKCFVFVRPVVGEDINKIESLPENDLDPKFLHETLRFCDFVYRQSEVKTIKGGHHLNGRMFGTLAQTYVETIRSGAVPCLENAVISMATIENESAVKEAMAYYQSSMVKLAPFPMEAEEFSQMHGRCEKEALEIFMKRSFKDEDHQYQQQLMEGIIQSYHEFLERNENSSVMTCHGILKELSAKMEHNLELGYYSKPGGYQLYKEDRDVLVQAFQQKPRKGVKAQEVLDKFLEQKKVEAETILQADKKLTDSDKQLAAEKERAVLMEQQKAAEEEKRIHVEQQLKDQERSHQENMVQMKEKMNAEVESIKKEAEKALNCKLKEQEELLNKGFIEKARLMEEEIEGLKKEINLQKIHDLAVLYGKLLGFALVTLRDSSDNQDKKNMNQSQQKQRQK
ncbi:guanylate-binding protein 1-like [Protopterus annectens]|uniref:guanylate-binding protein 1-like n=1 Tax=Protopterus annectens TaxID=7888 RepID=UPI001CF9968A|nr:guanylate-binding protein 1-like [Protopterus annectens]